MLAAVVVAGVAGCGAITGPPVVNRRVCGGFPAEMGGCDPGQPAFAGATCDAVAVEWGPAVERLVTGVFAEPPVVGDEQRSVRIRDAMILASLRAALRLEALGLVGECSSEAFMAIAEPRFTEAFRERIDDPFCEGEPVATWDES